MCASSSRTWRTCSGWRGSELIAPAWVGWLVDGVIVFTLVEFAWLGALRGTRGWPPLREVGLNLLSGLCLMLSLRAALQGAHGLWIVAGLLASGLAHAADLRRHRQRRDHPCA